MRRAILIAALVAGMAGLAFESSVQAQAPAPATKPARVQCRDAKGKLMKCAATTAAPAMAAAPTPAAAPAEPAKKPSLMKSLLSKKPAAEPAPAATPAGSTMAAAPPAMKAKRAKASGPKTASAASTDPAGATATCKDGTYWHSASHAGSCSHHGGVKAFL